jgi:hypothetical protein
LEKEVEPDMALTINSNNNGEDIGGNNNGVYENSVHKKKELLSFF